MNVITPAAFSNVADLRTLTLPSHAREDGTLVVAEAAVHVPYVIERMFTLQAPAGARRGQHAHKLCTQFMVCVAGAVDVICDDGRSQRTFSLDRGDRALLVPPTIWNIVDFPRPNSTLVVLCDRRYEAHDYIRDYDEFLTFRKVTSR